MAASVPVLLVAGVLPWQRDVMCTQTGCGSVLAGAWGGSPAWTLVLLAGLALAGAWVLTLPARGRVPSAVAALTAAVAVLAAAVVVMSADALVFGRTGLIDFQLPVTETFPVLAVHPAEGLVLGLVGLLLQAVAGWSTLRHRHALISPLRPPVRTAREPAAFAQGPISPPNVPPGHGFPSSPDHPAGRGFPAGADFPPGAGYRQGPAGPPGTFPPDPPRRRRHG
jgi:hypothetical protein